MAGATRRSQATARYEKVSVIGVTDAEGRMWASSFRVNPVEASVADRDYFIAHQQASVQGIFFSEAFTGKISGKRSIAISIGRRSSAGKFDGIVFATVPLDYFMRFWKQFAPSSGYLIPMIRGDGTLIVRSPALNNPERLDPNGPFVSHVRRSPRGIYTAKSRVDGIERINAYSQIKDYPLYVSYCIEKDVALQQWRRELMVVFAVALAVMAALATLMLLLMRQSKRERQAVAKWRTRARSVLFNQAGRPGNRPRAVDGVRLRQAVWWRYQDGIRHQRRHRRAPIPAEI